MKFLLSLTALAVIMSVQLNAQPNRIYSISINGGIIFPFEDQFNEFRSGYTTGIDLETRKNNLAIFASFKLNIVEYALIHSVPFDENDIRKYDFEEISAGGRLYIGNNSPLSANIDLGLSLIAGKKFRDINWGVISGIRGNISLNKNFSVNLNFQISVTEFAGTPNLKLFPGFRYSF